MIQTPPVLLDRRGHLAEVTLNRPEQRNAIDDEMATELASILATLAEEPEVWACVITGSGGHFSVGHEWPGFPTGDGGVPLNLVEHRAQQTLTDVWSAARRFPKPLVALVRGDALGAGLELALACDLRIAGRSARFGFPEVQHGMIPRHGGTQLLPRIVGRSHAADLILTGRQIGAEEAVGIGLVLKAVPDEDLDAQGGALVEELLSAAPLAARYAKDAMLQGADLPLEAAVTLELDLSLILQMTHDRAEGIRAFLEKRAPVYSGK